MLFDYFGFRTLMLQLGVRKRFRPLQFVEILGMAMWLCFNPEVRSEMNSFGVLVCHIAVKDLAALSWSFRDGLVTSIVSKSFEQIADVHLLLLARS